jgi:RNA polymerase sigma-70 factor, ECF subfamily
VTTANEAIAEMETRGAPFDLDAAFCAHYTKVFRIIARVVHDPARAKELAVEVFLKLWKKQLQPGANLEAWLYRVAVRTGLDELRSRTRRMRYEALLEFVQVRPAPATPEEIRRSNEEAEKVRTVLAYMDRKQAERLLLRSQEFSYKEAAVILRLTTSSVGTLVARAQEAFRKEYVKRYGQD